MHNYSFIVIICIIDDDQKTVMVILARVSVNESHIVCCKLKIGDGI